MQLYSFWRSSASYRVRIGLHLQEVPFDYVPVRLGWRNGEQQTEAFKARNPQGLVPVLVDGDVVLTQSLAILDWLDRKHPDRPLFPKDDLARAKVWQVALAVACEIQPMQGLRAKRAVSDLLGGDEQAQSAWSRHFIATGLADVEALLTSSGRFCVGDVPTAADAFLVPQVWNARAEKVDLAPYPKIRAIVAACEAHPAFVRAAPENQPDAGHARTS